MMLVWLILSIDFIAFGICLAIRLKSMRQRSIELRASMEMRERFRKVMDLEHECFPDKPLEWFRHKGCSQCSAIQRKNEQALEELDALTNGDYRFKFLRMLGEMQPDPDWVKVPEYVEVERVINMSGSVHRFVYTTDRPISGKVYETWREYYERMQRISGLSRPEHPRGYITVNRPLTYEQAEEIKRRWMEARPQRVIHLLDSPLHVYCARCHESEADCCCGWMRRGRKA